MPVVRSSEDESGIDTQELGLPENERAPPNFPAEDQVALEMVPLLPSPEASWRTVPDPSSKE
jgi:hypothetical protein